MGLFINPASNKARIVFWCYHGPSFYLRVGDDRGHSRWARLLWENNAISMVEHNEGWLLTCKLGSFPTGSDRGPLLLPLCGAVTFSMFSPRSPWNKKREWRLWWAKHRRACTTAAHVSLATNQSPGPTLTPGKMWVGQVPRRKMKRVWWLPSFASALEAKQLPPLKHSHSHVLPSVSTPQEQTSHTGLGRAWGLDILDDQSNPMLGRGLNHVGGKIRMLFCTVLIRNVRM